MTAPTCRQIMATGLAATATAGAPAIAADDRDRAEWLALWLDFMAKEHAIEELPDDHTNDDAEPLHKARWAAGDTIRERPATSLAGFAVKLAYALYQETWQVTADEFEADGIPYGHRDLGAVYLDAVRLAGLPEDLWRCAWVDCGPIR